LIPLPATFVVRWRWPIVLAWTLVAALLLPVAREVHHRLQVGGQKLRRAESTRAERLIRERFATPYGQFAVLVVRHESLTVDDPRFAGYVDSLTLALNRLPFVLQTLNWRRTADGEFVSADRRTTFLVAGLRQQLENEATTYVPHLREAVREARAAGAGDFTAYVTGTPAFDYDTRTVAAQDSARTERLLLPLTWLLLVVAFGAVVAALVPVAVGFIAITITLGVVAGISAFTTMSVFVLNITTMVGLGVGIDYSLLVVTRFREELESGAGPLAAAERTVRTAGRAVIVSGVTVMVGLLALMTVPLAETRSVGLGGLLVVSVAVLLSISFLPAMLAILGHRVDWPRLLAARIARSRFEGWNRYALRISRHPERAAVMALILVLLFAAPVLWIRIGLPVSGWFPKGTEAEQGLEALGAMGAAGSLQPLRVLVSMEDGSAVLDLERLRGLRMISDSIRANPRVREVRGLVDLAPGVPLWRYVQLYSDTAAARVRYPDAFRAYLSRDGAATLLDVVLHDSVTLDGSLHAVAEVRRLEIRGLPELERAEMLVGGFSASNLDFRDELVRRFPLLVILVLGVTGVMLALVFRSVLVPIKAILMNTLSVAAAFGLTVVVFQWGVGGSLIGLEAPTRVIFVMGPVLVFAIVFGLSMDYEVFLLARIKEEFDLSHDNDAATTAGLAATGATITSAAMIMILVFGAFAWARVLAVQLIGFGLAVAVLLDATIIRMVMVPAVMHIAGHYNWWPGYRRPRSAGHYRRGSGSTPEELERTPRSMIP
jgi:RND superfamily putative drug exporter